VSQFTNVSESDRAKKADEKGAYRFWSAGIEANFVGVMDWKENWHSETANLNVKIQLLKDIHEETYLSRFHTFHNKGRETTGLSVM